MTLETIIALMTCIFVIAVCSKKSKASQSKKTSSKPSERNPGGGKQLPPTSEIGQTPPSRINNVPEPATKEPTIEEENNKKKTKRSARSKTQELEKEKSIEKGATKSRESKKEEPVEEGKGSSSQPMMTTQGAPTDAQDKKIDDDLIYAEKCDPMEETLDEANPVVHERILREATTKMITDPQLACYKGNVDQAAESDEGLEKFNQMCEQLEEHIQNNHTEELVRARRRKATATIDAVEKKFNEDRAREARGEKVDWLKRQVPPPDKSISAKTGETVHKSKESRRDKSTGPPPRITYKDDKCRVYETREQFTEEYEELEHDIPTENSTTTSESANEKN